MAAIMVVDDEPDIVLLVQRILEREGHVVIGASSGREALERLKESKPDLILLDIMMPYIDGWQTLRLIRGRTELKDTPIAMLTAVSLTPETASTDIIGETIEYIQKPIDRRGLTGKVNELLCKLKDIEEKMEDKVEDQVTGILYRNAARKEMLHLNLSANLRDILGRDDGSTKERADEIREAIKTQDRMVDLFKNKRREMEERLDK